MARGLGSVAEKSSEVGIFLTTFDPSDLQRGLAPRVSARYHPLFDIH